MTPNPVGSRSTLLRHTRTVCRDRRSSYLSLKRDDISGADASTTRLRHVRYSPDSSFDWRNYSLSNDELLSNSLRVVVSAVE